MTPNAADYVREVNRLSEDLLRSHGELLRRKNVLGKQQLLHLIKIDLDKLTHALLEVKENSASSVLRNFFRKTSVDCAEVCARLTDQHIYHVGFEIHEPLELVLYGINHWIEQSKRVLGVNMRVRDHFRFPASPAFQQRVGAYTEIMRIWLEADERVLMLELFDIHRPADLALETAPRPTHRNFNGLFQEHGTTLGHGERLIRLFDQDPIWHYALHVKRPADVVELHAAWQALARENADYVLPYAAPVYNQHDGSFHTKIIRPAHTGETRLELEFVTAARVEPFEHR